MIECENNEEFIIANLSSAVINETLDLAFNDGEKICFKVDGPGTVHLTGNLMDEDSLSPTGEDFADMLEGSDSEMESEEEEEAGERIQEVVEKSGKRKKVDAVKDVVAKKAKIDVEESDESGEEATTDADTTANATTGDDDDDSDDSDEEDDSEEEEVEGATPKQKKEEESKTEKVAAVKEDDEDDDEDDDDSDEEDESDEGEEEEP